MVDMASTVRAGSGKAGAMKTSATGITEPDDDRGKCAMSLPPTLSHIRSHRHLFYPNADAFIVPSAPASTPPPGTAAEARLGAHGGHGGHGLYSEARSMKAGVVDVAEPDDAWGSYAAASNATCLRSRCHHFYPNVDASVVPTALASTPLLQKGCRFSITDLTSGGIDHLDQIRCMQCPPFLPK
ncbi:hypothetical protein ABZP36_003539 [Zizania latifolia]